MTPPPTLHGTAVAWGRRAVLLRGSPGAGKSDLALRLIDQGCILVADDRVVARATAAGVSVAPAPALAGRIEARGLGILVLPHLAEAPLALVVDLVPAAAVERFPDPAWAEIAGMRLPCLGLAAFEASTPLKIRHALAGHVADGAVLPSGCKEGI